MASSWNINTIRSSCLVLWIVVHIVNFNVAKSQSSGESSRWICPAPIFEEVFNCSEPMDEMDLLGSRFVDRTCLGNIRRDVTSDLLAGQCYLDCTPDMPYVMRASHYSVAQCVESCLLTRFSHLKYKRDCGGRTCQANDFAADQLQCVHRCPQEAPLIVDAGVDDLWCVDTCPQYMYVSIIERHCTEQCTAQQFIVDVSICVDECPGEAPWIVPRTECPECPQNCAQTCPRDLYEHDRVCVDQCPDFIVSDRVCVSQCPDNSSWSVGKHCMEKCPLFYVDTVDQTGLNVCSLRLGTALVVSTSCLLLHSVLLLTCWVTGLRHRILTTDKKMLKVILKQRTSSIQLNECDLADKPETSEMDQEIGEIDGPGGIANSVV